MPTRPEEWAVIVAALGLFAGLLVMLGLVIRDTIRREGRWGVNWKGLAGAECPQCGEPVPAVRVPKNRRQTLWGGWTCDECGCEIDKWGREVPGTQKRRRPRNEDEE
jgi:hypothetical protein